jgi:hypothetical protein
VASGEWRVASGEWRVASGEWRKKWRQKLYENGIGISDRCMLFCASKKHALKPNYKGPLNENSFAFGADAYRVSAALWKSEKEWVLKRQNIATRLAHSSARLHFFFTALML